MKPIILLLTMSFLNATVLFAQTPEDSVKAVVNRLFAGMKNADAEMMKSIFADSAKLQTISRDKQGNTIVRNENLADFINFLGKQSKGAADERIEFKTVLSDGALAMAWTPYQFYFNGKFSHCGVNSFQLVRIRGEWKIQYLIDTRRKENCE